MDAHKSDSRSNRYRGRKKSKCDGALQSGAPEQFLTETFQWQHPKAKGKSWRCEEMMNYILSRPEELANLEKKLKDANAVATINVNSISVFPRIQSQKMPPDWRRHCDNILQEIFSKYTVRKQTFHTFNITDRDDGFVVIRNLKSTGHGRSIAITGPIDLVAEKVKDLQRMSSQESQNDTLPVPLTSSQVSRLTDEFLKKLEHENCVKIRSNDDGISIQGKSEFLEATKEKIISEVYHTVHGYVIVEDWLKPLLEDFISTENEKYDELQVALDCVVDEVVLTGHPFEVAIFTKLLEDKVAEVKSRYGYEVLHVRKQFHGCIIGKGGKNIKLLKDKYKQVEITIPDNLSEKCDVKVKGSKCQVNAAVQDIRTLVNSLENDSKKTIRFLKDEVETVKCIVNDLKPHNSEVKVHFRHNAVTFTGTFNSVQSFADKLEDQLTSKRQFMQTQAIPITPLQAIVINKCRKKTVIKYLRGQISGKVTLSFEKSIPALMIKGSGIDEMMEAHVKIVEMLQQYSGYSVLDLKIDDSERGKFIRKLRKNIKLLESKWGELEIITGDRRSARKKKNVTLIGRKDVVENAFLELEAKYNAERRYPVFDVTTQMQRQESAVSNDSSSGYASMLFDEKDRSSDCSSVSENVLNAEAVFCKYAVPDPVVMDFVCQSEIYYRQLRDLFPPDESVLLAKNAVTVAGQTHENASIWRDNITAKLDTFFHGFKSSKLSFHQPINMIKSNIEECDLVVRWAEEDLIVTMCGVTKRVDEKLEEFERIKNQKQHATVEFPCDKHLLKFMRHHLKIEDDMTVKDYGHVSLSEEKVTFSSEVQQCTIEEWKKDCESILKTVLNGLACEKLVVPSVFCGHMRAECRTQSEFVVEFIHHDSALCLYGYKGHVNREMKRLQDKLHDLKNKKKTVTMEYKSESEKICTFIKESTEHMENFVRHLGRLGSPVVSGNMVTVYGDILENERTEEWEYKCRTSIEQYFCRYKEFRLTVKTNDNMSKQYHSLTKPGIGVLSKWVEDENCFYIVGMKDLVDAMARSLKEKVDKMHKEPPTAYDASALLKHHSPQRIKVSNALSDLLKQSKQRLEPLGDVEIELNGEGVEITGNSKSIQAAKRYIESLVVEELCLKKYGILKFLKKISTICKLEAIEIEHNCVIHVCELPSAKWDDERFVLLPKKPCGILSVKVVDGDITDQHVDAIVNTTNISFSFDGPLSKHVFHQAGEFLRNDVSIIDNEIRSSRSGFLNCKNILHIAIPSTQELHGMEDLLLKVLKHADKMGFKSIAFPAIGTGNGGWKSTDVSISMRDAFNKFKRESKNVELIKVVLGPKVSLDERKPFYQNLKMQSEDTQPALPKESIISDFLKRLFPASWTGLGVKQSQTVEAVEQNIGNTLSNQHARILISAENSMNLSKAVTEVSGLADDGVKEFVLPCPSEIEQSVICEIEHIANEDDVCVVVSRETHTITIQGYTYQAVGVKTKIEGILKLSPDIFMDAHQLKDFSKMEKGEFEQFCKETRPLVWEDIRCAHTPLTKSTMSLILTALKCSSGVDELEFRDSSTSLQLLQMLCTNSERSSPIHELSITAEDDVSEIIPMVCKIMRDRTTKSLNLAENNLVDNVVSSLEENLMKNPVYTLKALDISNNEKISNYALLAKVLNTNNGMSELRVRNCGIVPERLKQLRQHLTKKLLRLDLSYNAEMSMDCCTHIGHLLKTDAEYLGMSECDITETEASALFNSLAQQRIKLNTLDLSYNCDLRYSGVSVISKFVAKCELSELSLAGCNLDLDCIVMLRKNLNGHKLKKLDLSDNSPMNNESVQNLGQMVADCPLENLDLSNCALSSNQIDKFSDSLGNSKICRLNISDDQLMLDQSMIEAIAGVAPKVVDELTVCYENVDKFLPSLHKIRTVEGDTGLQIVYGCGNYQNSNMGVHFLPKVEKRVMCIS